MPNTTNYAIQFEPEIKQKYTRELLSADLTTQNVNFVGANKIRIPYVTVSGYKDHTRNGGFNRGNVGNDFMEKTLSFDRDIELFVDSMDVDETNQALSAANITNTFLKEQAIPETDCYRFSKLYTEFTSLSGTATSDALTGANILDKFDTLMEEMDEDEVPEEGRILYATPTLMNGVMALDTTKSREILNSFTVKKKVPQSRFYTAIDLLDGKTPGEEAGHYKKADAGKEINFMIIHKPAVIKFDKHTASDIIPASSNPNADADISKYRKYGIVDVYQNKVAGIYLSHKA